MPKRRNFQTNGLSAPKNGGIYVVAHRAVRFRGGIELEALFAPLRSQMPRATIDRHRR